MHAGGIKKLCLILGLLYIGVNGEKKINLEDIERDNLRTDVIPKEQKYLTKSEIGQQQYQIPNQYHGPPSPQVTYVTPSSPANRYTTKEQDYPQQNNVMNEQVLPPRYYNEYQQQLPLPAKEPASNLYGPQQFSYQPEVNVGNQLQSVQQKTITAKYGKNVNKDTVYIDIPMMHLLTYYPNLDVNSGKSSGLLVPQLTPPGAEHISIPLYTSALSEKPTYQLQYASKHNNPPFTSNKITKSSAYTTPVISKKYTGAPLVSVPPYVPSDQSHAQGRQFLYTRAYVAPSQPQYVSQLVYAQPTTVYMHATPVYNDVYARAPSYVQDNSLHGNVKYATQAEQLDSAAPVADELPNQASVQQTSQSVAQNYVKDPEEPSVDLIPPQLASQDFKAVPTTLLPVPQEEESIPEQNHVGSSEPRSLLDSYVPSKLIAAQDSDRYQERPIKLESGFLPSKENFLHKKRKTNY
ncbi:PREDICTED: uncharacterized protein LOC108580246 [Habropoda laboriosa]|uniref:uncharacterized protein LOC108580246 n=1 Tax=Habropoda laboriosa TaxID=597456 RepID=UPI00083D6553|nr:PREDICTED: uncharacterized protein LOC108580246 [Habropoda laboriosa]